MKVRVGIKDVAAAAGVSVTTVSHALNDKGRLPAETRERVRAVARDLDYRPSRTAQNLKGGKTGLLGLTVSQPKGRPMALGDLTYFVDLMSAASTAAIERGYALVLAPGEHGLAGLSKIALDGAIVVDPIRDDPLVGELQARGVPLVTTGRVPGATADAPWVDNDQVAGSRAVLDHLAARGASRVALVTTEPITSYTADWQATYKVWCAERDQVPIIAYARDGFTEAAGFAATSKLLDAPEPPDAIWATLDRLALGALLAAKARHVKVPDEIMIVGSTDSHSARSATPALTTLDLYPTRIGQEAVRLLVRLLESRPVEAHQVVVPTGMHLRASTRRRRADAA